MNRYEREMEREAAANFAWHDDAPIDNGLPGGISDRDPHFATGGEFETEPVPPAGTPKYTEDQRLARLEEKLKQGPSSRKGERGKDR